MKTLLLWLVCAVSCIAPVHAQDAVEYRVEQPPRAFGWFIGDVLVQSISADAAIVPEPEFAEGIRVDDYLYRLPVRVTPPALELRYQVINVPRGGGEISLPAVRLPTLSGAEVMVSAWPFAVSSLLTSSGDEAGMVADRSPLAVLETPNPSVLKALLAGLLAMLLSWLTWWAYRHFKDAHRMPFARARAAIARLPKRERNTATAAWVALHHAFNEVAGRTVGAGTVPELLQAAPWLATRDESIRQFFAASDERFFRQAETAPAVDVARLCETLYGLEKQHATSAAAVAA